MHVSNTIVMRAASALHARYVFGRRVQVLATHLAALVPDGARTILDVGCGDGTLASLIAHRIPRVVINGLELRARPRTAIPVREFDGATIPFADRSADVIMMVDMLHHAEDPRALLREAARVARQAVLVKDHSSDPWLGYQRLRVMDWVGNVGHGVELRNGYWSRAEWDAEFAAAGLREATRRVHLGLYPRPARWLFETGLHFVSRLVPATP